MEEVQLGNLIALISANATILWIYFKGEEYLKKLRNGFIKEKKSNFHEPCHEQTKEIMKFLIQNYDQTPDNTYIRIIFEENLNTEKYINECVGNILHDNIVKQILLISLGKNNVIYDYDESNWKLGHAIIKPLMKFLHERDGRPKFVGKKENYIIDLHLNDDFMVIYESIRETFLSDFN